MRPALLSHSTAGCVYGQQPERRACTLESGAICNRPRAVVARLRVLGIRLGCRPQPLPVRIAATKFQSKQLRAAVLLEAFRSLLSLNELKLRPIAGGKRLRHRYRRARGCITGAVRCERTSTNTAQE